MNKQVAIQGIRSSFHDIAARKYFKREMIEIYPCDTFEKLILAVVKGTSQYALMAVHNSIVGPLVSNYELLVKYPVRISGEITLPIQHHLMALGGQTIDAIHTVYSHPVALKQCTQFLRTRPHLNPSEQHDTAGSAQTIVTKGLDGTAAIASKDAAQNYGLKILAEDIGDRHYNATRFLILTSSTKCPAHGTENKATVIVPNEVSIDHQMPDIPGSITPIVRLKDHDDNSTRTVLDITSGNGEHLQQILGRMARVSPGMKVLGLYHENNVRR